MSVGRWVKAAICALAAGIMVFMTAAYCRLMIGALEEMLATKAKFPEMTHVIDGFLPISEPMMLAGVFLFSTGYFVTAFFEEPGAVVCFFHATVSIAWLCVVAVASPWIQVKQGLSAGPSPPFEITRDLPRLIFCGIPIVVGLLLRRQRRKAN